MVSINPSANDVYRFGRFVSPEPNSGCWLWTGAYINSGYGTFRAGSLKDNTRRNVLAHRFALEANGHIFSDNEQALHKCDNKSCVNPEHLYVGSRKDNARDAVKSGKIVGPSMPGSLNPNCKLREDHVRFIRSNEDVPHAHLAKVLGISATHVSYIKKRQSWRSLDGA